jgi:arylsulfatase A-like enzyme
VPDKPNILFVLFDQMQAAAVSPQHPCPTPAFERLAARGVRFENAYTPCPVCSPARASLLTGLMPHNHGVLEGVHGVDADQAMLRTEKQHWAQKLVAAGYRTGYFGKWHLERSGRLEQFGWETYITSDSPEFKQYSRHKRATLGAAAAAPTYNPVKWLADAPGYRKSLLYGVTDIPPEYRNMGIVADLAGNFLEQAFETESPWCCFINTTEPHDPFIAGREAYERISAASLPLPPSKDDPLEDRPRLYQRIQRTWMQLTEQEQREAAACYYASITEVDHIIGNLIDKIAQAGQADKTIIVLASDHGELLGAHGLYLKTVSAFEEVYNIPLIVAGPGVVRGMASDARVGLHDLCPTLLELADCEPIKEIDGVSFAPLLSGSDEAAPHVGFAEYHGARYRLSQRVLWQGPWKLVFNGFDFDELYNLDDDPYELHNLAQEAQYASVYRDLMAELWRQVRRTGDRTLMEAHYGALRLSEVGPDI